MANYYGTLSHSHLTQVVSMEAGADFPESNHEAMADMVSRDVRMRSCDFSLVHMIFGGNHSIARHNRINDGLEAGKGPSPPGSRQSSSGTGPV